jgi:hypothetical protein
VNVQAAIRAAPTIQLLREGFETAEEKAAFEAAHPDTSAMRWAKADCKKGCNGSGMITVMYPTGGEGPIQGLRIGPGGSIRTWCVCATRRFARAKRQWVEAYRKRQEGT